MIMRIQMFFLSLCIVYPIAIIYGQNCPAFTITTSGDGSNGFCQGDACQNTTGDTTTVLCNSDGNTESITSMLFTVVDGGTGVCGGPPTCNTTIDQTAGYGPPGDVELNFVCNSTTGTYTIFGLTIANPTIFCDASFICNGIEMSPPANPCNCPVPDYRCTSTTMTTTTPTTTVPTTTVPTTTVPTTTVPPTTVPTTTVPTTTVPTTTVPTTTVPTTTVPATTVPTTTVPTTTVPTTIVPTTTVPTTTVPTTTVPTTTVPTTTTVPMTTVPIITVSTTTVPTTTVPTTTVPTTTVPTTTKNCCLVGGTWSEWASTGTCSDVCGSFGTIQQTRICTSASSNCPCTGPTTRSIYCNIVPCQYPRNSCCNSMSAMSINGAIICGPQPSYADLTPVTSGCLPTGCCPAEGVWSTWSAPSACNDTCGSCGVITRTRTCMTTANGCPCTGSSTMYTPCATQPCPYPRMSCCGTYKAMAVSGQIICGPLPANTTDAPPRPLTCSSITAASACAPGGTWSAWSASACNDTCGMCGSMIQTRTCTSAPACPCTGSTQQIGAACANLVCKFPHVTCCAGYTRAAVSGQFVCQPSTGRKKRDIES